MTSRPSIAMLLIRAHDAGPTVRRIGLLASVARESRARESIGIPTVDPTTPPRRT